MSIALTRDVEAIRIPSGEKIMLPAKTEVIITQALGGTYTIVIAHQAGLYRVNGADADALGKEPAAATPLTTNGSFEEAQVWEQLKQCYDPEIPVNIVDLGLIYSLAVSDCEGGKKVNIQMTLTAPGCGMGPSIAADARQRILSVPGVADAEVDLTWEPPWNPDRISPEGREKLGIG